MRRIISAAAIALAFAACTDVPVAPDSELQPQFARRRPVVHIASGSGHFFIGGTHRVFSFTAQEYDDGTFSGQFQLKFMASVFGSENPAITSLQAEVTCLSVDDFRAWIAGVVTSSSIPAIIGRGIWFRVEDQGERHSDTGDALISGVRPLGTPQRAIDACEANTPRNVFPIVQGNIQVAAAG